MNLDRLVYGDTTISALCSWRSWGPTSFPRDNRNAQVSPTFKTNQPTNQPINIKHFNKIFSLCGHSQGSLKAVYINFPPHFHLHSLLNKAGQSVLGLYHSITPALCWQKPVAIFQSSSSLTSGQKRRRQMTFTCGKYIFKFESRHSDSCCWNQNCHLKGLCSAENIPYSDTKCELFK